MIKLFSIPRYQLDTVDFSNVLHGENVVEFEQQFAAYVGAKYACSMHSATNAIFLLLRYEEPTTITIPSIMPPVVANAVILSGHNIAFKDDVDWVGGSYILHEFDEYKITDSAQRVERNQFSEVNDSDLMIFSFYPTKPVGSVDGGIVVSNDKSKIDRLRILSNNGMSLSDNSWDRKVVEPGWKMYMNSIQASIASQSLNTLDERKTRLSKIRDRYNEAFGLNRTSDHLYRINVKDNAEFISHMQEHGIVCGVHYHALHLMECYYCPVYLPKSEIESQSTSSIPFHHMLSDVDVGTVIKKVKSHVIKT